MSVRCKFIFPWQGQVDDHSTPRLILCKTFQAFRLYPDETTADTLYNGIKYKDLPFVTIVCQKNNTKFYAYSANEQQLFFMTPAFQGFMNAKKRTNVGECSDQNLICISYEPSLQLMWHIRIFIFYAT